MIRNVAAWGYWLVLSSTFRTYFRGFFSSFLVSFWEEWWYHQRTDSPIWVQNPYCSKRHQFQTRRNHLLSTMQWLLTLVRASKIVAQHVCLQVSRNFWLPVIFAGWELRNTGWSLHKLPFFPFRDFRICQILLICRQGWRPRSQSDQALQGIVFSICMAP